jgi:acyl-CoA dehydrogenase
MSLPDHIDWPFLEPRHRDIAATFTAWVEREVAPRAAGGEADVDAACRDLVARLGAGGWLEHCASDEGALDVRTLCLLRETLAYHWGLADFALAMQGLGSGPVSLFGTPAQKAAWLPGVRAGTLLPAFALSEPEAGSDVAALATTATPDGDDYLLDGSKTWISNGGIADLYIVFARTGEAPGARGLSAFAVDADTPGLEVAERIDIMAPHPLATLRFTNCRVPRDRLLGIPGEGFKVAMATLDIFRTTVGAAALGFARRALDETLDRVSTRRLFGGTMAEMPVTRATLAEMALGIESSALLVYRAAWTRDVVADRVSREAALAKLHATEAAQKVIDSAVQLHGGHGVVSGSPVESLYREIRALRIYEGASEVQREIIARELLKGWAARDAE